jgi:hypothetical protein
VDRGGPTDEVRVIVVVVVVVIVPCGAAVAGGLAGLPSGDLGGLFVLGGGGGLGSDDGGVEVKGGEGVAMSMFLTQMMVAAVVGGQAFEVPGLLGDVAGGPTGISYGGRGGVGAGQGAILARVSARAVHEALRLQ